MADNELQEYANPGDRRGERTLCCFVLDRSGSMDGQNMESLNNATNQFIQDIANDIDFVEHIEIAVVAFDHEVEVTQDAAMADEITQTINLEARGLTSIADAVEKGIEIVEKRKDWYKEHNISYKRAFIILITDGAPTQDLTELSQKIANDTKTGKYVFLTLGVEGADINALQDISGYIEDDISYLDTQEVDAVLHGKKKFKRFKPLPLKGAQFSSFFKFIKKSSKAASTTARATDGGDGVTSKIFENPNTGQTPDWLLGADGN